MNTEDKFYFRRATDSEIENLLLEAESLMDDGFVSKAIPYLRKASNSIDTNTSPRLKKILSDMMREANVRFSRPGQPERFGGFSGLGDWKIDFRNVMKERVDQLKQLAKTLKASVKLDRISPNGYYSGSVSRRYGAMEPPDLSAPGKVKALIQSLGGYIGAAFSRPGQPERFGLEDACWEGYEPVGTKQKDGRTVPNCVPKHENEQPEEFAARADGTISGNKIIMDDGRTYEIVKRQEATGRLASDLGVKEFLDIRGAQGASYMVQLYKDGNYKFLKASGKPVAMTGRIRFSRPGQPDKFDASSLDRGDFAEASTSPMLGKLLAAKVMPEGGWRAVQVGSDTLVISFEDADLASDFGRRVATKGYNATSPVQAIGRYWNVEVKNGK